MGRGSVTGGDQMIIDVSFWVGAVFTLLVAAVELVIRSRRGRRRRCIHIHTPGGVG